MRATDRRARARMWEGVEALESRSLLSAVQWDGGGDGLHWEDPLNWSGDVLPGPSDDVTIDVAGLATITHASNNVESVHSLTCAEQLTLQGGSLFIGSDWQQSGPLNLLGTRVIGGGNLIITGQTHWYTGRIDGPGFIQIASGGTLSIDGTVTSTRAIYNGGSLAWTNGNLTLQGNSIVNLAGQTFSVTSTGTLSGQSGDEIDSAGTIDISSTARINVPLEFISTAGVLHVHGSINSRLSSPTTLSQLANVQVDAPATLTLSGRDKLLSGTTMQGDGSVVLSGGSHTLAGALSMTGNLTVTQNAVVNFMTGSSIGQFTLSGGTLVGAGDLFVNQFNWGPGLVSMGGRITATLVAGISGGLPGTPVKRLASEVMVTGSSTLGFCDFYLIGGSITGPGNFNFYGNFHWVSGSITGSGALVMAGFLYGPTALLLQRDLTLSGDLSLLGVQEVDLAGTTIRTSQSGSMLAGNFLLPAGQSLRIGGVGDFSNPGRHLFIDGDLTVGPGVSFNNGGVLHLTGHMVVPGASVVQLVNGELQGGSWLISGSGRLQMPGAAIHTNSTTIVLNGRYASFGALAPLSDNRGMLCLFGGASLAITPASGTFLNESTLQVYPGSTLAVSGGFHQTTNAQFRTAIAGGAGIIWATGAVVLDGSVIFSTPLGDPPSVPFWFIHGSSISGSFSTDASYLHGSGGGTAHLQYTPTLVRLIFT